MLPITRKISKYNFSSRNGSSIKYIVCHYTGNSKDTALSNANFFNQCNRNASAHYFVDDKNIYQVVEESNSAWAVGDGKGRNRITNRNSISIEMCTSGNYQISEATENNAAELVKYLMKKYNVKVDHVVRHYDASYKCCPNWSNNCWSRWNRFKSKLINNGIWLKGTSEGNTNKWWYRHLDGSYTSNDWEKIDGEWYYFAANGWMQTGWIVWKGNDYYLYSNGVMAHDITLYGYKFDSDGVATKL